jgi:hypothetical protein
MLHLNPLKKHHLSKKRPKEFKTKITPNEQSKLNKEQRWSLDKHRSI